MFGVPVEVVDCGCHVFVYFFKLILAWVILCCGVDVIEQFFLLFGACCFGAGVAVFEFSGLVVECRWNVGDSSEAPFFHVLHVVHHKSYLRTFRLIVAYQRLSPPNKEEKKKKKEPETRRSPIVHFYSPRRSSRLHRIISPARP